MLQNILSFFRTLILYKILKLKTIGVRIAIFDHNKVLLVRHRYNKLWVFPGGGIKYLETALAAAIRECGEETQIEIREPLVKLGEYINNKNGKNDTVIVFVCRNWVPIQYKKSLLDHLEISDMEWFDLNNLPIKISSSTKQRLLEIQNPNIPISKFW